MSEHKTVRTRVAPSPTGDPHIGTAFMALFNYCFAKSRGGQFLLRIEDTDQTRSTRESEQAILDSLKWIGIPYDEGPDVGGPCGPYRQSERLELYRAECEKLIDAGHAYYCFATPQQLEQYRQERQAAGGQTGYDGSLGMLTREEAAPRIAAGESYVIRMKVPTEGECVFTDALRGEIRIPWVNIDHQILLKSDGFPTYHLANVVDDHHMAISHVIRGEEWINSAPKHLLLYQYFGWEAPELIHLPLLRNPDKSKLSKRKNPTSINYYRRAGYLPEAVLNYLGLMGYTLPDGREFFTIEEMIETFDITRVSLGGPVFDVAKLTWLNGRYLRERLSAETILERLKAWMLNDETLLQILPLAQARIEKLSDFIPMAAYMFADKPAYDPQALITKGLDGEKAARLLKIVQWELEKIRAWDKEAVTAVFQKVAEVEGLKLRELSGPFYVAISGAPSAMPLFDTMAILGSDMSRRRLQYALEGLATLGFQLSEKTLKKMEKDYQKAYGKKD